MRTHNRESVSTHIVYVNMFTFIDSSIHVHKKQPLKHCGDMSQTVSSRSPVGEGTVCAEDAVRLHNHCWVGLAGVKSGGISKDRCSLDFMPLLSHTEINV